MKNKKYIVLLLAALTLSLSAIIVKAQSELSITAFPSAQDKEVVAGQNTHMIVQFKNNTDAPIIGQVKVVDYIIRDKSGEVVLLEDFQEKPKYAAASWINLLNENVTIPPRDSIPVDLYVTVPQEVTNCGNYALVYIQPETKTQLGKGARYYSASTSITRLGALINLKVTDKECVENLNVTSFTTNSFQEYGPVDVAFDVQNSGNVHVSPQGLVSITNILGKYVDSQKIKDQNIFPETVKKYENQLGHKWMIGRYKVILLSSYGVDGKKLEGVTYIWVFPWRVGLIILFTLAILYLIIRSMINRSHREKTHMEEELEMEKSEIEKLKSQLRKKTS